MALRDIFDIWGKLLGKKERTVVFSQSTDGEKQLFVIDSTPLIEHELKAKVTENEIEDGSVVSDHIIKQSRVLSFEGFISDDPMTTEGFFVRSALGIFGQVAADSGARGPLPNNLVLGGASILTDKLLKRVRDGLAGGPPSMLAFQSIEEVYDKSIPCKIVTNLRQYTNMGLEDFKVTRTARTVNALVFRATFKELRIVTSEVTDIRAEDTANGNSKTANKGSKGLQPTTEAVQQPVTVLKAGFNRLKGAN